MPFVGEPCCRYAFATSTSDTSGVAEDEDFGGLRTHINTQPFNPSSRRLGNHVRNACTLATPLCESSAVKVEVMVTVALTLVSMLKSVGVSDALVSVGAVVSATDVTVTDVVQPD